MGEQAVNPWVHAGEHAIGDGGLYDFLAFWLGGVGPAF